MCFQMVIIQAKAFQRFQRNGFRIRTDDNLSVEKTRVSPPLPALSNHPNKPENFSDNHMPLKM